MLRRHLLKMGAGVAAASAVAHAANPRALRSGMPELSAEDFHAARRFASTRFGRIAYVEQGVGTAAIFLHGWPLNGFHWRGAIARLAATRRCIAPDFLGLGYTEAVGGQNLSPVSQADMIAALLGALTLPNVDVVSNDSGTAVAQLLAVRQPGLVRSMLLTNGDVHTNSPPEALKPAIEAARQGKLADIIERHLIYPDFAASPQGLGEICYTDPTNLTAEAMKVYFEPLLASPVRRAQFQAYGDAFEPNPLAGIEGRLERLQVPTRMLWGTGDIHYPQHWASWLDERLPASRGVRLVPGAKLFFTEEQPDLVAAEAQSLWASC